MKKLLSILLAVLFVFANTPCALATDSADHKAVAAPAEGENGEDSGEEEEEGDEDESESASK